MGRNIIVETVARCFYCNLQDGENVGSVYELTLTNCNTSPFAMGDSVVSDTR